MQSRDPAISQGLAKPGDEVQNEELDANAEGVAEVFFRKGLRPLAAVEPQQQGSAADDEVALNVGDQDLHGQQRVGRHHHDGGEDRPQEEAERIDRMHDRTHLPFDRPHRIGNPEPLAKHGRWVQCRGCRGGRRRPHRAARALEAVDDHRDPRRSLGQQHVEKCQRQHLENERSNEIAEVILLEQPVDARPGDVQASQADKKALGQRQRLGHPAGRRSLKLVLEIGEKACPGGGNRRRRDLCMRNNGRQQQGEQEQRPSGSEARIHHDPFFNRPAGSDCSAADPRCSESAARRFAGSRRNSA